MGATELVAYLISCDYAGCDAEVCGLAGDTVNDLLGGTTWGRDGDLYFCYDHFDTENIEATRAALRDAGRL